jgi:hypothetical protein
MTLDITTLHSDKPVFDRNNRGCLSTFEYIIYKGILAKKKIIATRLPNEDLTIYSEEHPTKENYYGLLDVAQRAGLRK